MAGRCTGSCSQIKNQQTPAAAAAKKEQCYTTTTAVIYIYIHTAAVCPWITLCFLMRLRAFFIWHHKETKSMYFHSRQRVSIWCHSRSIYRPPHCKQKPLFFCLELLSFIAETDEMNLNLFAERRWDIGGGYQCTHHTCLVRANRNFQTLRSVSYTAVPRKRSKVRHLFLTCLYVFNYIWWTLTFWHTNRCHPPVLLLCTMCHVA